MEEQSELKLSLVQKQQILQLAKRGGSLSWLAWYCEKECCVIPGKLGLHQLVYSNGMIHGESPSQKGQCLRVEDLDYIMSAWLRKKEVAGDWVQSLCGQWFNRSCLPKETSIESMAIEGWVCFLGWRYSMPVIWLIHCYFLQSIAQCLAPD